MALGLTSVTFRKLTPDEIISLAVKAGCEVIEWGGDIHIKNIEEAQDIRKKCRAGGIGIHSYGSYYRLGQGKTADFESLCEITCVLEAKIIRVWLGDRGSKGTSEKQFEELAVESETLSRTAMKFGLTVAFEFHNGTYNDTGESSRKFLQRVERDNVKTYWQPMFAGNDIENLNAVIGETVVVHMFNWSRLGVRYPLKRGETKIKQFLDIIKSRGYEGDIILEFVKGDNPENFLADFKCLKEWV